MPYESKFGNMGGGGGGYTKTEKITVKSGDEINVSVASSGSTTTVSIDNLSISAKYGMYAMSDDIAGGGGSGGGAPFGGIGGSNGGNGGNGEYPLSYSGGAGQGTTTRAFNESTGTLYSGGGGGYNGSGGAGGGGNGYGYNGGGNGKDGASNTGGGGGGCSNSSKRNGGGAGGSGIAIIRWGY